jgi:hypothetical protein
MNEGSDNPIRRQGGVDAVEPRSAPSEASAHISISDEALRHLLQQGIDSGPGVDADVAFARIRAQLGSAPGA